MADLSNPFSIRLTKRQAADLDSLVAYDGLSRQELIRRAVDMYLEDRRKSLLAQVNASRSPAPPPQVPPEPAGVPAPPAGGGVAVAPAVSSTAVKIARR